MWLACGWVRLFVIYRHENCQDFSWFQDFLLCLSLYKSMGNFQFQEFFVVLQDYLIFSFSSLNIIRCLYTGSILPKNEENKWDTDNWTNQTSVKNKGIAQGITWFWTRKSEQPWTILCHFKAYSLNDRGYPCFGLAAIFAGMLYNVQIIQKSSTRNIMRVNIIVLKLPIKLHGVID